MFPISGSLPSATIEELHNGSVAANTDLVVGTFPVRGLISAHQDNGTFTQIDIGGINAATGLDDTETILLPANGFITSTKYWLTIHTLFNHSASAAIVQIEAVFRAGPVTAGVELMSNSDLQVPPYQQILIVEQMGVGGSAVNITIVGTDIEGNIVSEVVALSAATIIHSVLPYHTVTSLISDGSTSSNLRIGFNNITASQPIPVNWRQTPITVQVTGIQTTDETDTLRVTFNSIPPDFGEDISVVPGWQAGGTNNSPSGHIQIGTDSRGIPAMIRVESGDGTPWDFEVIQGQNS